MRHRELVCWFIATTLALTGLAIGLYAHTHETNPHRVGTTQGEITP